MFDIGFWELLFIGIIGLLVVGPDRLPALATHTGRFVGRMRLKMRRIKDQIRHELENEHLKSLIDERDRELDDLRQEARNVKQTIDHAARSARYGGAAGPSSHPADMIRPSDEGDRRSGHDAAAEDRDDAEGGPSSTEPRP